MTQFDIIIVGGGVAGLSLACALPPCRIALIERQNLGTTPDAPSSRAYALNHYSEKFLKDLNIWSAILFKTPYSQMQVWEQEGVGRIEFSADAIGKTHLGHIVDEPALRWALQQQVMQRADCQIFAKTQLVSLQITQQAELLDIQNRAYTAPLVIAADGGRSWVREQLKMPVSTWSSDQMAIVTTLTVEHSHQNTAWQSFTVHGPLAFLPLPDPNQVSIVWSLSPAQCIAMTKLTDAEFCAQVSQAMNHCCGRVQACKERTTFPLIRQVAKNYIRPHVALIGDAAHTVHPLAGLGINLGLKDVSVLSAELKRAQTRGYAWGSLPVLRRYERARRGENQLFLASMEGIKNLFCSQSPLLKQARGWGLNWANKITLLKRFFIRQALG